MGPLGGASRWGLAEWLADCHWIGKSRKSLYPLVMSKKLLKMAIEIVDLPIENGGSFHSYVSLPEGWLVVWNIFYFP